MSVYVIDCETSSRNNGEVIELAWIRIKRGRDLLGESSDLISLEEEGSFCQRFQPTAPITSGSMAVHHILPIELDGCPPAAEAAIPVDARFVIGHSVDYDFEALGSPSHVKRIDTHAIAQWLWPDATGYSQTALIYMLEGATVETRAMVRNAHSALADVRLNHGLLRHILRLKPEITTWPQLWEYSEQCRIPRTCPMKKYEGVLLEDLDDGFISWCLNLYDLDPYYRKGLEKVMRERFPQHSHRDDYDEDQDDDDLDEPDGTDESTDAVAAPSKECAECLAHPEGRCDDHMPF